MYQLLMASKMEINIADDFNLQAIANSGQAFRAKEIDNDIYRFIIRNHILYINELSSGKFNISCPNEEWHSIWEPYFDLNRKYESFRDSIFPKDKFLLKTYDYSKGIRILKQDPWETLISFILSQRKSIEETKITVESLASTFGKSIITPYETIHLFPSAIEISKASTKELEKCKLGYRLSYIQDAIQKVMSGIVNLRLVECYSDVNLIKTLMQIKGVGCKIASCVGLFSYGRTGLIPTDTWIKKVIDKRYGGNDPLPSYGEIAGIMQQYIFYYAINHKEEILNPQVTNAVI